MTNFWLVLPKPFTVLAPMDDVTDNVFRQVVLSAARPDVFFTEFVNSDGLNHGANGIPLRKLQFTSDQKPIVAQIWGNDPESMQNAAKIVKDLGFDGIDINMGCPVRDVVKKGSGAGLIGNYNLAGKIIKAVKNGAGKMPVSIKTRLGKNENIAKEWITFLLKEDIAALTVHARVAGQMSHCPADWNEIGKIVKIRNKIAPKTIIIGNGDIKSYKEVGTMHKKYGVEGIMIGRGIFANPWVFDPKFKARSKKEYLKLLTRHIELFETTLGEKKHFAVIKKFFKMYVKDFEGANTLRKKLMDAGSFEEMKNLIF